jgi:hypothetical protein
MPTAARPDKYERDLELRAAPIEHPHKDLLLEGISNRACTLFERRAVSYVGLLAVGVR